MEGSTIDQTHTALNKIRDDHAHHPAVAAIELVNEPMGPNMDRNSLEQFYYDSWGNLQDSNVAITFHDAFLGVTNWNDFGNNLPHWLLDTHHYEMFEAGDLEKGIDAHISSACSFGGKMASNNKVTVAGEWTGAMTDCAKWLNGLGVGARYDGSFDYKGQTSYYIGSCDGLSTGTVQGLDPNYRASIGRFIEAQMDGYEKAGGWIFWTWKTEGAPEWDMEALFDNGVIASPVTNRNRKFPLMVVMVMDALTLSRPRPVRLSCSCRLLEICSRGPVDQHRSGGISTSLQMKDEMRYDKSHVQWRWCIITGIYRRIITSQYCMVDRVEHTLNQRRQRAS